MNRFEVVVALVLATFQAQAQEPIDALSQCLADNTSGKDRKDLARWVFFAMASHPEIKQFTAPALVEASEESQKAMAKIFMRLMVESCPGETQAAFKLGGAQAVGAAFEVLGKLAMQELMSNKEVKTNMTKFEKLIDHDKLNKVFGAN